MSSLSEALDSQGDAKCDQNFNYAPSDTFAEEGSKWFFPHFLIWTFILVFVVYDEFRVFPEHVFDQRIETKLCNLRLFRFSLRSKSRISRFLSAPLRYCSNITCFLLNLTIAIIFLFLLLIVLVIGDGASSYAVVAHVFFSCVFSSFCFLTFVTPFVIFLISQSLICEFLGLI